jgi:hypothetical protein
MLFSFYLAVSPGLRAATVWDQGAVSFTKPIGSAPATGKDCLTPEICLTRGFAGGLYNPITGTASQFRWAAGAIGNWATLDYSFPFMDGRTVFSRPLGHPFVLHIIPADLYVEFRFQWWSIGKPSDVAPPGMPVHSPQNPGFAYVRTAATGQAAPAITQQPIGGSFIAGRGAALSVIATGNPPPNFQWRKNGIDIPGATSPNPSVPAIAFGDSGSYTVRIANSQGAVISEPALISVWDGLIARYPWSEDFHPDAGSQSWVPEPFWSGFRTNPVHGVMLASSAVNPGYCGPETARLGVVLGGVHNRNEAVLKIDLAGRTGVRLRFRHGVLDSQGTVEEVLPPAFNGQVDGNGISVSADGMAWRKILGLNPSEGALRQAYRTYDLNLDSAVASVGLAYASDFRIKIQQSGIFPSPRNGHCFDDLGIVPASP